MRRTSLITFREIKEEGLLSRQRLEVYTVLYERGPLTAGETCAILGKHGHQRRFSELKKLDVIYEVEERPCTVTGRMAIAWDVTEHRPKEFAAPPTKMELLQEENARLRSLLQRMKAKYDLGSRSSN